MNKLKVTENELTAVRWEGSWRGGWVKEVKGLSKKERKKETLVEQPIMREKAIRGKKFNKLRNTIRNNGINIY